MANILLLLLSLASGLTYNVVNLSIKNHIRTQAETYLFNAVSALAAILNMHAFGKRPMSYTTVIISCSMSSRLCSLCFAATHSPGCITRASP